MKTSILIASYCRPEYLQWNLRTLLTQGIDWTQTEAVVLNDGIEDSTLLVVEDFARQGMNLRYIFTGQRNRNGKQWRVPGYALNIGIKECDSEIVVLSCAEMYHVGKTLEAIVTPVANDPKVLGTPMLIGDDDGTLFNLLPTNPDSTALERAYKQCAAPKGRLFYPHPDMPFWMAINRQEILNIGGVDEDFTGIASEDNDLMDRLRLNGCRYQNVDCHVIHLYHGWPDRKKMLNDPKWKHNRRLRRIRAKQIVRNQNREWGKLDEKFPDLREYAKHETFARDHQVASSVLWNLLPNGYSVLDVGCGDKVISNHVKAKVRCNVTTVDGWEKAKPDILMDLETHKLPFDDKSQDIVLLLDVVEHLEKQAAIALIKQCQRIARVRVILYTPKEFDENRAPYESDPLQKGNDLILHKSAWYANELIGLGFTLQDKFASYWFGIWEAK